jgi:hypothetical protein
LKVDPLSTRVICMSIDDIIEQAGGAPRIADASAKTQKPISRFAVYKWQAAGIPQAYWPLLMKLVPGLTVQEIFDANRELERRKRPKRRVREVRASA